MAFKQVRRVVCLQFILFVHIVFCQSIYRVPNVRIQALRPKGFRASIPDAPKMGLFAFHGNVNKDIGTTDVGSISGEVTSPTDGWWVVEAPELTLKVGDVIKYHVFVAVGSAGYLADNLTHVVTELEDPNSPVQSPTGVPVKDCRPTVTTVRGSTACAGQTLFEDNFDRLNEDVWRVEQYNPLSHPEHPFITYQRVPSPPTVTTRDGFLVIRPTLQQHLDGFSNESLYVDTLYLFSGCTAPGEACVVSSTLNYILPPVVSGRVTSKAFAFTYGTVHVRAKLPQGDWLYPELLLEPFMKKYGSQAYVSGLMKIASARGNKELSAGFKDYSNRILYGGPIMDYDCRETLLRTKGLAGGQLWGDDFHIYSLRWAPDRIILSVDGEEWGRIEPAGSGWLVDKLPESCRDLPRILLSFGSKMAPFDHLFQLAFGVAAGGSTEFPQGAFTGGGHPKPWINTNPKAQLRFWEDVNTWLPTWVQPELLIDYVKVVAL